MSQDGEYKITDNGKVCNVTIVEGKVSMEGDFEACQKAKSLIANNSPLPPKKT